MKYQHIVKGIFRNRPNRFVAEVEIDGTCETVHVKNTGRCRELLIPGVPVILELSDNANRKTKYDLICVYKENLGWVNIDSQAPNKVVNEWLKGQGFDVIRPEYTFGASRIDFYMEKDGEKYLLEVKGCTLEIEGIGYFPDAPTVRGCKHLRELAEAVKQNYHCMVGFVIQMEGITQVLPNDTTDPAFEAAWKYAEDSGVKILYLPCAVTEDTLKIVAEDMILS